MGVRRSATVNDTALRGWLLGFGSGVEVLEPAALRAEMVKPPGGWLGAIDPREGLLENFPTLS